MASRVVEPAPRGARSDLQRFAASLRWRQVWASAASAAVRVALCGAVPLALFAWLLPAYAWSVANVVLVATVVVAAVTAVLAWWHTRRLEHRVHATMLQAAAPDGSDAAAALQICGDEFLTWFELARPHVAPGSMFGWLERDLLERLAPEVRRSLRRTSGRWRLGRCRWLLLALLLVLLAWLLSLLVQVPWSGALGGKADRGGAQNSMSGIGVPLPVGQSDSMPQAGDDDGDGEPDPDTQGDEAGDEAEPDEPEPEPGDEPNPPDTRDGDDPDAPPGDPEPAPILDLPNDERFVLPDFIGDGPTRRARMHAAELLERPVSAAGAGAAQRPGAAAGAVDEPLPRLEPDFERAAERAVRSRHVPAQERAIVARYFEALRRRVEMAAEDR